MKKKVRFIVNPKSGSSFGGKFSERLVRQNLDLSKFDYDIFVTKYAGHAIKIAQQSLIENIDIIAVAGGDGTQNEVGQMLLNKPIIMASIPTGSGNANARKLKIPIDVAKSIQLINTGKALKIDALILNGQPFFMAAGIGYDAKVIEQFNKLPFRGVGAYLTGILSTFLTYKLPNFTIEIDGETIIETEAFTVLVTSTGQLGYNIEFTKNSILNDGKFEVTIVKNFDRSKVPGLIYESFFGDIASQEMLETHRVNKSLKVRANKIESIQMDGDYKGKTNYIEVTCQKEALNFLVDKDYVI
ncbi:MAG TPA: diacylglycerol kinase family lipid kinase [Chitinophagales bacterium]|jgi:diacylglycerol kinase (ATP)|nr:diacylglycerol kinase family lipid kinase [Chitinophagales bacterium]MBP6154202.1 diacylglycerol kinase family lipid kinase [Chitinophagales bacterium]HQV78663.1 diacylglycerol kinase family lipid kinase [Chitinophagales bacterium]HQW78951.1 diacylglycerol kinase family lipid kinase [Chitinophagales bacterium]HRB68232.1 diacylglycerol kinase family lipid kinase [Chitinophagales bacterium]